MKCKLGYPHRQEFLRWSNQYTLHYVLKAPHNATHNNCEYVRACLEYTAIATIPTRQSLAGCRPRAYPLYRIDSPSHRDSAVGTAPLLKRELLALLPVPDFTATAVDLTSAKCNMSELVVCLFFVVGFLFSATNGKFFCAVNLAALTATTHTTVHQDRQLANMSSFTPARFSPMYTWTRVTFRCEIIK